MPIATETFYQEMLDNAKNYNKRICIERRQRLPFLDSQTGVAQNHSSLVVPYRYRGPGRKFGQIYTYPSRRWKKKSSFLFNEYPLGKVKTSEAEVIEETPTISSLLSNNNIIHSTSSSDVPSSNNKILNYPASNSNSNSNEADLSNQQGTNSMLNAVPGEDNAGMAADWDMQSDGGEVENDKHQSDSSDYEETYVKKRKKGKGADKSKSSNKDPSFRVSKKGSGKGRGKKDKDIESNQDKDKPYSCDYCPMKYKTRPGLSYHVSHSHNKSIAEDDSTPPKSMPEAFNKKPMPQPPPPPPQHHISPPSYLSPPQLPSQHMQQQPPPLQHPAQFPSIYNPPMMPPVHMVPPGHKPGNKYCDFCLGDENENKKTGFKEEMVSCADCGRSGHPSCLQFSANMIISVKKYPWQCIECKSCGLCGTSDNDDQLLFCDDCDRGYHMYCLKPPLSEPPEGSWSCHLCINEFYSGSKEDSMSS